MEGENMQAMNEAMNEARAESQKKYDRDLKRQRLDNIRRDAMAMAIDSLRSGASPSHELLTKRAESIFQFLKG